MKNILFIIFLISLNINSQWKAAGDNIKTEWG